MREIQDHKIYELLKTKYDRIGLDYVILQLGNYEGEKSHKTAVIKAFSIINQRRLADDEDAEMIEADEEKMRALPGSMDEFLRLPEDDYYDSRPENKTRSFTLEKPIAYCYAFLEPPYSVKYLKSDFIEFNNILFPNREDSEVFCWNDDFSNYFDEGKEWWGTGLWTVFDRKAGMMVVIGASLTD